jgi:hypothetical protein
MSELRFGRLPNKVDVYKKYFVCIVYWIKKIMLSLVNIFSKSHVMFSFCLACSCRIIVDISL